MVKALSSYERAFFIENMIGEIKSIPNQELKQVLMEQLSLKPYAGSFIINFILSGFD
jgi:hypothetical protein